MPLKPLAKRNYEKKMQSHSPLQTRMGDPTTLNACHPLPRQFKTSFKTDLGRGPAPPSFWRSQDFDGACYRSTSLTCSFSLLWSLSTPHKISCKNTSIWKAERYHTSSDFTKVTGAWTKSPSSWMYPKVALAQPLRWGTVSICLGEWNWNILCNKYIYHDAQKEYLFSSFLLEVSKLHFLCLQA